MKCYESERKGFAADGARKLEVLMRAESKQSESKVRTKSKKLNCRLPNRHLPPAVTTTVDDRKTKKSHQNSVALPK